MLRVTRRRFLQAASLTGLGGVTRGWADELSNEPMARQRRVLQRRSQVHVLVHRGASEFAHENTLQAYQASLQLGADGNEIDIRATRDGVLVCFHDDMLDHLLEAYGTVGDYDWEELRAIPPRRPGWLGAAWRIPTLEEVFELHVEQAGLIHLDIKQPGIARDVGRLLDRFDLWDHVVAVNNQHGEGLLHDDRYRPGMYKGSLYADRAEVDPRAIAAMLEKPGEMVVVDDPRGVLVHLGRPLGPVSLRAGIPSIRPRATRFEQLGSDELLSILRNRETVDMVPPRDDAGWRERADSIRRRAEAAEEVRRRGLWSQPLSAVMTRMVKGRSLHRDWMYHGLDGAAALRVLARPEHDDFPQIARDCLWRDDPAVEELIDPAWPYPRAWKDFRTKVIVFPLLEERGLESADPICRDYLALSDDEAHRLGPPCFEAAARTLLSFRADAEVARSLLTHRRPDVRGRAILQCLARHDEGWAEQALRESARHALDYVVQHSHALTR
jgi:hypothetical protein